MKDQRNWVAHFEFSILLITLLVGLYLIDRKIDWQSMRTDKLYEMFIELIEENR